MKTKTLSEWPELWSVVVSDVVLSKCMHHKNCSLIAITGKCPNKNTAVRFSLFLFCLFVCLFSILRYLPVILLTELWTFFGLNRLLSCLFVLSLPLEEAFCLLPTVRWILAALCRGQSSRPRLWVAEKHSLSSPSFLE